MQLAGQTLDTLGNNDTNVDTLLGVELTRANVAIGLVATAFVGIGIGHSYGKPTKAERAILEPFKEFQKEFGSFSPEEIDDLKGALKALKPALKALADARKEESEE